MKTERSFRTELCGSTIATKCMAETGKGSSFVQLSCGKRESQLSFASGQDGFSGGYGGAVFEKGAADWLVQNCSFPAAAEDGVLFSSTTREEAGFVPGAKAYTLYFKEKLGGLTVRSADVQISSEGIVRWCGMWRWSATGAFSPA